MEDLSWESKVTICQTNTNFQLQTIYPSRKSYHEDQKSIPRSFASWIMPRIWRYGFSKSFSLLLCIANARHNYIGGGFKGRYFFISTTQWNEGKHWHYDFVATRPHVWVVKTLKSAYSQVESHCQLCSISMGVKILTL
jgi:hypothetical protein